MTSVSMNILTNQFSPRHHGEVIFMRQGFFECIEHNRKNRKKAIEEMPYASKIIAVVGGYLGFESWDDYEIWRNQK